MAGKGQEIPTFSDLEQQTSGNSDDPFSSYNASKKSDDDPFASYNAKKSSEIGSSPSERPNITISVPIRKRHDEVPSKMRRVTRSNSRERDDLRIEVKQHERSREHNRSRHEDRSRDRRDDRHHSRSHRSHDRNNDRSQRPEHRYDDRRSSDHRDDRQRRDSDHSRNPGSREDRREKGPIEPKPHIDVNEFRKVPAFRQQVEEAPLVEPVGHSRDPHWEGNRQPPPHPDPRRHEPYPNREHWNRQYVPPPPPPPPRPHPAPSYLDEHPHHHSERLYDRPEPHEVNHYPHPQRAPYPQVLPAQSYIDQRSRPPYLHAASEQPPPERLIPPHIEHRLQKPDHQPEPYPHWDRSRPPPPSIPDYHNQHHPRDRFGPLREAPRSHDHRPPPQKLPDISDVAQIMKGLKESASKNLESTKEMITTLLPPKPAAEEAGPVNEGDLPPRLGDSNYSSVAVSYKEPSPPPKPRTPAKKGPDYTSMFSKTANAYKSNWVKTPEKEEPKASGSNDAEGGDRVIKLSGSLEVDLDDVNESQVNLLAKYLKFRTRGLRVVADNLPLRIKKQSENDDEDSALETVKSVRRAFNTKPNPIPGTMSCDLCRKYNLPPDEYRRHINSDFHCWMEGSWKHRLPGYLPRFSMVWCTICRDFFMITFEGNTVLGHEDKEDHKKNKSVYRLQYDDVPNIKFCLLSELRTTKVKMPTPLKCKYFTPREALESYKAAYSKLCDKNLVVD